MDILFINLEDGSDSFKKRYAYNFCLQGHMEAWSKGIYSG